MQLVRLTRYSFVRNYENIGYLYNQLSRRDFVYDNVGAEFLLGLKRYPVAINEIIEELSQKYPDVKKGKLKKDFIQFINDLEKEGFVILGKDEKTLNQKDEMFSYNKPKSIIPVNEHNNNIVDSKIFLNEHFKIYPRIFRAQIELTTQCNLKCIHCYLPPDNKKTVLSKKTVFSFLDQLKSMGTLEVIFTGGEALLHKDLIQILYYAKGNDFSIILLTNGNFFNHETIKAIKILDIALIQISLYSMEPNIHDKITGVKGSWHRSMKSIESLIFNNIRVEIACPIIKENENSFQGVIEYGKKIGINVSNDLAIMAREDFSRDNLNHRVNINKIHDLIKRRNQYSKSIEVNKNISRKYRPKDPVCGMGLSLINLSADGNLHPCPGFKIKLGNIYKDKINDIWERSLEVLSLRKITNKSFKKCMKCEFLDYCFICPAKFYNESGGDIFKIDKYFCEIAKSEKNLANSEI